MNELIPHTVKDTGTKLLLRRVSPLLAMELRKAYPTPKPPVQNVDVGGEMRQEYNWSDPDYEKELNEHNNLIEQKVRRLMFLRGVVIPEENITWEQELADMRKFWLENYELELPSIGSDQADWVSYCAIGTSDDFEELYDAITTRSQPTAEAIEATKSGFPG